LDFNRCLNSMRMIICHGLVHKINNGLINVNSSPQESSSIDVFVQQRNEHIFANSPHFSAPWGSEVQMMLTERNVARLDDVYGECTNSTRDVNTFYSAGIYTIQGCLQSCYQNQVHLVCGCTDPRQLGIAKIPICGLNKGEKTQMGFHN
jgi:hypothetical protein